MHNQLPAIAMHAYTTTPIYEDIAGEKQVDTSHISSISKLPIMKKEYMMHKETGSLSSEYIVKAYRDELINMRTSGSTGKYLNIYWDKADFIRSLLSLWIYRKKYYGVDVNDKMCFFYTSRNVGSVEQETYMQKNQLGFSKHNLDAQGLVRVYEKMVEYQPKWLNIQPSIAALLCQSIRKYNLSGLDSIEYVEFTGEMLSESTRREVEDIFGCKTANQYGTNETNSIAYECPYGQLHILKSNAYVEILDDEGHLVKDGEEGNVCVTSLTNRAMPFIRYLIGDRGTKKSNVTCPCGNCNDILDITAGRKNDYIIDDNGEKINTYVFVRAIDNVNLMLDGVIKQFQIVQRDIGDFLIKLVIDEEVDKEQLEAMFYDNMIQLSLAGANFEFDYYDELLPEDGTGKLKYFSKEVIKSANK